MEDTDDGDGEEVGRSPDLSATEELLEGSRKTEKKRVRPGVDNGIWRIHAPYHHNTTDRSNWGCHFPASFRGFQ